MVVGLPFFGPKEGRENDDSPMDLGSVVLDVSPADPGDHFVSVSSHDQFQYPLVK